MNEQFEKYITPVRELNSLAISNLEKLVDLQVKYFEDSLKAGFEQLKTASSISDVEGLKNYITTQVAVSKQLTERIDDVLKRKSRPVLAGRPIIRFPRGGRKNG